MSENFIFRENYKIGYLDAESDQSTLKECFVDYGMLDMLRGDGPERVVIGRTGSGKSALLEMLLPALLEAVVVTQEI